MGEQDCPTRHHPDRAEHARDVTSIGPEGLYVIQSRAKHNSKKFYVILWTSAVKLMEDLSEEYLHQLKD